MSLFGLGIGIGFKKTVSSLLAETKAYIARVLADSGTIESTSYSNRIFKFLKDNSLLSDTKLLISPWMGVKERTSSIYTFFTKLFSVDATPNDATQTTELNQPYKSGNIAPNEVASLLNPSTDSGWLDFTDIAYTALNAWSATFILNYDGYADNFYDGVIIGQSGTTNSGVVIRNNGGAFHFRNESGTTKQLVGLVTPLIAKNNILTLIAPGNDTLQIWLNGSLFSTETSIPTNVNFNYFLRGSSFYFTGNSFFAHICSLDISNSVVAYHAFLRTLIPEIESVTIGSQVWSTSNLDIACSTNGTIIPDGNLTANWTPGTSAWCYHTDTETGAIYGKLYNKEARDVIIANPPSGWHVATEAELTILAASGGNALKVAGTDYWSTTGGTNSTGFSAIGGASRNADGTFNPIKNTASFWCADSDKVLLLNHDDNTATIQAVTSVNEGHSIRLIED